MNKIDNVVDALLGEEDKTAVQGKRMHTPFGSYVMEPDIIQSGDKFYLVMMNGPIEIFTGPKADTMEKAVELGKEAMKTENPGLFRNLYGRTETSIGSLQILVDKLNGLVDDSHYHFQVINGKIHLFDDDEEDFGKIEPVETLHNIENADNEARVYNVLQLTAFLDSIEKDPIEVVIDKVIEKGKTEGK